MKIIWMLTSASSFSLKYNSKMFRIYGLPESAIYIQTASKYFYNQQLDMSES